MVRRFGYDSQFATMLLATYWYFLVSVMVVASAVPLIVFLGLVGLQAELVHFLSTIAILAWGDDSLPLHRGLG
jgi:hypothetical protein